jgi:predicted transposase/invertase (TIGR01784 family)
VRVRLANRCQLNIEMQSSAQGWLDKRGLFYWARLYSESLERGQDYAELLPTISLFILDFVELPTRGYHSEFRLLDVREHHPFSDAMVLHVLELPKVPARLRRRRAIDEPLLLKWARFLRAKTAADLEPLAMTDPVFEEAKDALERLSDDPKARELARERELWEWNYNTRIKGAEREGERRILERQLSQKFGQLPDGVIKRLRQASESDLERWADRILSAATLDEVFGAG